MAKKKSTPRNETHTPASVENWAEKIEQAEKLTREIIRLLEYDRENVTRFLLLIDLFEQDSNDAVFINTLAASIRQMGYGVSEMAGEQSEAYISTLRMAMGMVR